MITKLKPAQYQERIIKALVKAYEDPRNAYARTVGADEPGLAVLSGFCNAKDYDGQVEKDFRESIRQLESRDWITIADRRGIGNWSGIKPTPDGIKDAHLLMRPRWRKVVDYVKGDVRTVVVAVITALIITLLTNWLLRLLGWTP